MSNSLRSSHLRHIAGHGRVPSDLSASLQAAHRLPGSTAARIVGARTSPVCSHDHRRSRAHRHRSDLLRAVDRPRTPTGSSRQRARLDAGQSSAAQPNELVVRLTPGRIARVQLLSEDIHGERRPATNLEPLLRHEHEDSAERSATHVHSSAPSACVIDRSG